jgi:hypothetical protein
MRQRLSVKFILPTAVVAVLGVAVLGMTITRYLGRELRGRADQQAADQVEAMLTVLQTADNLSSQSVRSAMKVLLQEGERIGAPETDKPTTIEGQMVPELRLGRSSQVGNFALVDRIKQPDAPPRFLSSAANSSCASPPTCLKRTAHGPSELLSTPRGEPSRRCRTDNPFMA